VFRFPGGVRVFLIQSILPGSRLQKTSISMISGAHFPEAIWPEREADRVPSSKAVVHAYSYRLSSICSWSFVTVDGLLCIVL